MKICVHLEVGEFFFKGIDPQVRPSLSEKSFPVRRVTAKKSQSGGRDFFLFLIFH